MLYILVLRVQDHLLQKKAIRYRKLKGLNSEVLRKAVADTSLCSNPKDGLEVLVTAILRKI